MSKDEKDLHAFIQTIISYDVDGKTNLESHYHKFPMVDLKYCDEPFSLKIGNNTFKEEGINIDLNDDEYSIHGSVFFSDFIMIERNILSPTAMGYFAYLPFMECYHDIISMNHILNGNLSVNNKKFDFNNGKGYIEKDWGTSFPKEYIWLQSNHFDCSDASIIFSLAHIPFMGNSFQGFICNLTFNNQEYRFATYNNSKLLQVNRTDDLLEVVIEKKNYKIIIKATVSQISGELKAPNNGAMEILIKEGLSGIVNIKLFKNTEILFEGLGKTCAIEIQR